MCVCCLEMCVVIPFISAGRLIPLNTVLAPLTETAVKRKSMEEEQVDSLHTHEHTHVCLLA